MAMLSVTRKGGKSVEILAEAVAEVIDISSVSVTPVSVPSETSQGENIGAFVGTGTFVSEDLTKQILNDKIVYNTSENYAEGSTGLFLNGLYMTRGVDYEESGLNEISFIGSYATDTGIITEDFSILSIRYIISEN
jgi:hypothetical protein